MAELQTCPIFQTCVDKKTILVHTMAFVQNWIEKIVGKQENGFLPLGLLKVRLYSTGLNQQTSNLIFTKQQIFRLVQIESTCRRQNKCYRNTEICFEQSTIFPQIWLIFCHNNLSTHKEIQNWTDILLCKLGTKYRLPIYVLHSSGSIY